MALTELRRNNGSVSYLLDEWRDLVDSFLLDASSLSNNGTGGKRKVKQTQEEDEWTLEDFATTTDKGKNDDLDNENDNHQLQQLLQRLTNTLQKLRQFVCINLPRIISRIVHATAPILHELSRGYFVPFLTVALGCLGRIHSLLTKIGREVTSILRETVSRLRNFYLEDGMKVMKTKDIDDMRGSLEWKMLQELVMTSFVVEDIKRNKRQIFSPQQQPLTSTTSINHENEWNNLMEHYLDVSHDELTKNINDFVKGKRLDDAVVRFGLGANKLSVGIPSKLISLQEQTNSNSGSDELVLDAQNRETQFANVGGHLETAVHDTGELVNAHHSFDTTKLKSNSTYALDDDNMSRIKNERLKRQMNEVVPCSKKKKKRKRSDKIDDLISADDDNNDDKYLNNGATATDSLAVLSVSARGERMKIKKKKRKSTSVIDDIFK